MKNHSGFTLIELMIALACMVGVVSLTTQLTMTLYASWKKTAQNVQTRMALHAALDTLRRDLEHAPGEHASYEYAPGAHSQRERSQWYVTGPHELIWHDAVSRQDLRIAVVKGRLERCEGIYDTRTHQWHSRSVSVLAQDSKEFRCTFYTCATHGSATHDSAAREKYSAVSVTLLANNNLEEHALIALGVGVIS